jgi:hypothetical protein
LPPSAAAPQDCIGGQTAGGIIHLFYARTGIEQLLDDLKVIGPGLVDRRPYGSTEDRASIPAAGLDRYLAEKQQTDGVQLSTVRGPMKSVEARAGARRWIDATG